MPFSRMLYLPQLVRSKLCTLSTASTASRQFSLPFCSFGKMKPTQKSISPSASAGYSSIRHEESMKSSGKIVTNKQQSQSSYERDYPPLNKNKGKNPRRGTRHNSVNQSELEEIEKIATLQDEFSLPDGLGKNIVANEVHHKSTSTLSMSKNAAKAENSDVSEGVPNVERFNICFSRTGYVETQKLLRPGMVLLRQFISLYEQIKIVKTCQTLGAGSGGFYRPGYKDGAKLNLQMMCLGLNWDPQTRRYDKWHPVDDCEPPPIPYEFNSLVQRAIIEAHSLIKKKSGVDNAEDMLPSMSPDICIINFYTTRGKLGLHQDRDESITSLSKALPVVSFSIGNSAKFLYGDKRDEDQAEEVVLHSGDVLIFGGESRMVFHGVPTIIPKSAPWVLLRETGLCPGRLNLTFRQF